MIIHRDIEQGTPEWLLLRSGKITGTGVKKIITSVNLALSKSRVEYLDEKVVETIYGRPVDEVKAVQHMERGAQLEEEARAALAWMVEADVEEVAFIESDDHRCGVSPDGIIGEIAGVELKCPLAKTHAGYLRNPDSFVKAYRLQVQFGLWVTGWAHWFLFSYVPRDRDGKGFKPLLVEVAPDPEVHAAFDKHIPKFIEELDEAVAAVRAMDDPTAGDPFA